jgi:hypothetical protein
MGQGQADASIQVRQLCGVITQTGQNNTTTLLIYKMTGKLCAHLIGNMTEQGIRLPHLAGTRRDKKEQTG